MTGSRIAGAVPAAALLLLLAAGCGGGGEGGSTGRTSPPPTPPAGPPGSPPPPAARCTEREGRVDGYLPIIGREGCGALLLGETLFAADRLSTGTQGKLEFHTRRLTQCTMREDGADVVQPDRDTALRHVRGTIVCRVDPGGPRVRIETPGAEIDVRGTLFSLTVTGSGTIISLREGRLFVRSTADPDSTKEVAAVGLLLASSGQPPLRRIRFREGPRDRQLFDALRLGIVTVPADRIGELLRSRNRSVGAVVTETRVQAKLVIARNPGVRLVPFTTASILDGSSAEIANQGIDTIVGVGSFNTLLPAFERLRADLGASPALAHAPFDFGETTETGTTTTTTTTTTGTQTETGPPPSP